jgi:hypothetical protein
VAVDGDGVGGVAGVVVVRGPPVVAGVVTGGCERVGRRVTGGVVAPGVDAAVVGAGARVVVVTGPLVGTAVCPAPGKMSAAAPGRVPPLGPAPGSRPGSGSASVAAGELLGRSPGIDSRSPA